MSAFALAPHQLRLTIAPATLGFTSTAELQDLPLPWIGQERAHAAALFGLNLQQPDYHLFVLGEVGSGRTSLLRQAMLAAASQRPVPPDLCYLHQFDTPDRPQALRLPAGQGRRLRLGMADLARRLPGDVATALASPVFRAEAQRIEDAWEAQESAAFAVLDAFAQARHFSLSREEGHLVFTLAGTKGQPLTPLDAQALPPERRAEIDRDEQALRSEIAHFLEATRPLERARDAQLLALRRTTVQPLLAKQLQDITHHLALGTQQQPKRIDTLGDQDAGGAHRGSDGSERSDGIDGVKASDPRDVRRANVDDDHRDAGHPASAALENRTPVTVPAPTPTPRDAAVLATWLAQVERALLDQLDLFEPADTAAATDLAAEAAALAAEDRKDALDDLLARCAVNLVVDNAERQCAPVWVEDHPTARTLFGSIEHGSDTDSVQADHLGVHAGSLLKAHGGFILLHLHDLAAEEGLWPRLRRFLRCGRLQIDEGGSAAQGSGGGGSGTAGSLLPEAVEVDVKIVLIGSVDAYYALQDADPDAARRFRAKVDFVDRFVATPATHHASAVFVAHSCKKHGLPHCDASAVALLLEQSHREADDQGRQSALLAQVESLLIESAALCTARGAVRVEAADVQAAQQARRLRHNQPEEELHESITEGERLITLHGSVAGQINAMTQIDLGDYRFGFPVRITARTFAGQEGLLNIEREVDMSGPIHDKGVLILHSYLTALFTHVAPLALNASIVFEQEYSGVEGDSASCAELYALLSSLSGLPLRQGIAVTGALNQHGEVLPVGGINEKIEGWFQACVVAGLDGTHGVLIPARNRRHLMLDRAITQAVDNGLFHVYTMEHVSDGVALLTGEASGMSPAELLQALARGDTDPAAEVRHTVLQRAEHTLRAYRRACQSAGHTRRGRGGARRRG